MPSVANRAATQRGTVYQAVTALLTQYNFMRDIEHGDCNAWRHEDSEIVFSGIIVGLFLLIKLLSDYN